jgi:thioredoxin
MAHPFISRFAFAFQVDDPELAAIRARKLEQLMAAASAPKNSETLWTGPITLTDATFDEEVRKAGPILVDFWAEWCGPCHRVAPVLEEVARAHAGHLRLGKLNVDDSPRTPARFQITSIPTMLLFKNGTLVDSIVGAVPRAAIESLVASHL